jgi:hypothetical protein
MRIKDNTACHFHMGAFSGCSCTAKCNDFLGRSGGSHVVASRALSWLRQSLRQNIEAA